MSAKAGYSTPTLHVKSIEQSIHFYELLGFKLIDTMGESGCLGWARLHCEGGAIMFLRAEEGHPIDAKRQAFLLYMYSDDLPQLREQLLANGIDVPAIKKPDYMPSGEFYLNDPDGYRIGIGHWGEKEQREWQERLNRGAGNS